MNCLLIGGTPSVGKTEAINRLTRWLINNNFTPVAGIFPPIQIRDFMVVLEGNNKNNKKVRIIINSATDDESTINNFKSFFDINGYYDILISSVRNEDDDARHYFLNTINIQNNNNFILEIPLAKINKKRNNFNLILSWYETQIDNILRHITNNNPFDL